MKVMFARRFFGPDAKRYRPNVVHEVPDAWGEEDANGVTVLPRGTQILPEDRVSDEEGRQEEMHKRKMEARNLSAQAATPPRHTIVQVNDPDAVKEVGDDGHLHDPDEEGPTPRELAQQKKEEAEAQRVEPRTLAPGETIAVRGAPAAANPPVNPTRQQTVAGAQAVSGTQTARDTRTASRTAGTTEGGEKGAGEQSPAPSSKEAAEAKKTGKDVDLKV